MKVYITASSSINALTALNQSFLPESLSCAREGLISSAIEPDYKRYIPDAGSRRRMSRAVRMGVAAAMQCLSCSDEAADSIITATGLGCLGDTEKFLENVYGYGEELLNPTPFIQSTFNTVASQVAILTKNRGYNATYVHRGVSFEHAVLDACMQLREGTAKNVLVGSYEETTGTSVAMMRRLGYWRKGARAGEGAQFFLFSSEKTSSCLFRGQLMAHSPESPEEVCGKLEDFLSRHGYRFNEIDLLLSGKGGIDGANPSFAQVEALFPEATVLSYKKYAGDYPTVSSLALWLSVQIINSGRIPDWLVESDKGRERCKTLLLYNHYNDANHSFFLLEKIEQ